MTELQETEHPSFKMPTDKDIKIWRYSDLAKYLATLQKQSLFFSRATLLGDPFEGSSTKAMVAGREYLLKNKDTDPRLEAYKNMPDAILRQMGGIAKQMIVNYLTSCWHMNEHESAAMWSLYSRSSDAVCIQSTYRRLRSSLPRCVFVGEMRYIDYNTDGFHADQVFNFIMHKRKSFEHERELRAVFWTLDGTPEAESYKARIDEAGLWIGVDLPSLIERVYVSPSAAPWFAAVVREVTIKYGFNFPVLQSTLAEPAVY